MSVLSDNPIHPISGWKAGTGQNEISTPQMCDQGLSKYLYQFEVHNFLSQCNRPVICISYRFIFGNFRFTCNFSHPTCALWGGFKHYPLSPRPSQISQLAYHTESEHCQLLRCFQNQLELFGMVIMMIMLRITAKTSAMNGNLCFVFLPSVPSPPPSFTPKFGYLSRIFPIVASENISFNLLTFFFY